MNLYQRLYLLLTLAVFSIVASADDTTLTIGLIGDSTVADTYGWGPAFTERFDAETKVVNFARNGATLESLSKKLDELLKEQPDYVLIQFGHNDQKRYDTQVYADRLGSYVKRVTQAGGKAIILSSVTRRNFDESGEIQFRESGLKANLSFYAKAARSVAREQDVHFIDLHSISVDHHNRIGPQASAAYNFSESDTTHFSPEGARATADLIIAALKTEVSEISAHLKAR